VSSQEYLLQPGKGPDWVRIIVDPSLAQIIIRDLSKWLKEGNPSDKDSRLFSIAGKVSQKE
jgi:hypothetical protein